MSGVESGRWQFHVIRDDREVEVVLAMTADGHKYLKAITDEGDEPAGLLALPDYK